MGSGAFVGSCERGIGVGVGVGECENDACERWVGYTGGEYAWNLKGICACSTGTGEYVRKFEAGSTGEYAWDCGAGGFGTGEYDTGVGRIDNWWCQDTEGDKLWRGASTLSDVKKKGSVNL